MGAITDRGLALSALNCSGNLLDPHPERRQRCQQVYYDTIRVASDLGLDIVITQSGCPGAPDGGTYPNWVTATWPAEYVECGQRQWAEEVTPFWTEAGRFAADHDMKIAIEMHHGMVAYNPRSLLQLREIAGDLLGANLDPSHLWPPGHGTHRRGAGSGRLHLACARQGHRHRPQRGRAQWAARDPPLGSVV